MELDHNFGRGAMGWFNLFVEHCFSGQLSNSILILTNFLISYKPSLLPSVACSLQLREIPTNAYLVCNHCHYREQKNAPSLPLSSRLAELVLKGCEGYMLQSFVKERTKTFWLSFSSVFK